MTSSKIHTTGRQTIRAWVSKMADRRYHVPSIYANFAGRYIEMRMRRVHFSMRTEGIKAFWKRIRRCSVDEWKRYENDKRGRKSFWKRRKTAPFSFKNGLEWTGPYTINQSITLIILSPCAYKAISRCFVSRHETRGVVAHLQAFICTRLTSFAYNFPLVRPTRCCNQQTIASHHMYYFRRNKIENRMP